MARNTARLRVTGIADLRHAVRLYGQALVDEAQTAVTEAVSGTVADAKAAAPVGTRPPRRGHVRLRDSIVGQVKADAYGFTGIVRVKDWTAPFLEFGTVKMAARPHLIPAAIRRRRALHRRMRAAILRLAPAALGRPRVTSEAGVLPLVGME